MHLQFLSQIQTFFLLKVVEGEVLFQEPLETRSIRGFLDEV